MRQKISYRVSTEGHREKNYFFISKSGFTSIFPRTVTFITVATVSGALVGSKIVVFSFEAIDSLKTMYSTYALPFRITAADADSIKFNKKTNLVGVRFENMLFGNYWHGGAAVVNRPGKADTTMIYRWAVNDIASKIWTLTTVGPSTLVTNGYFSQTTTKTELKLVLKGTKVYVSTAAGSSFTYLPEGECTFNRSKLLQERKIFLKYSFVNGVNTYHCTDTLTFRNRLRDGINEWQDENPSHYQK